MAVDDGFYNPQSESQSAGLGLFLGSALETGEDGIRFRRGGAWAFVLYPTLYSGIGGFCSDSNDAALGCEFVCVGQQVDEYLRQPWLVALDQREVFGEGHFERLVAQRQKRAY